MYHPRKILKSRYQTVTIGNGSLNTPKYLTKEEIKNGVPGLIFAPYIPVMGKPMIFEHTLREKIQNIIDILSGE